MACRLALPELTEDEQHILALYTSYEYHRYNQYLRFGKLVKWKSKQMAQDKVKELKAVLAKFKSKKGVYYRNVEIPIGQKIEKVMGLKEGQVWSDKGFMSVTDESNPSMYFTDYVNYFFVIKSKTAKEISEFSGHANEGESVILPGAKFKVTKIRGSFFDYSSYAQEKFPNLDQWAQFFKDNQEHFPNISEQKLSENLNAQKFPLIKIYLEEL